MYLIRQYTFDNFYSEIVTDMPYIYLNIICLYIQYIKLYILIYEKAKLQLIIT